MGEVLLSVVLSPGFHNIGAGTRRQKILLPSQIHQSNWNSDLYAGATDCWCCKLGLTPVLLFNFLYLLIVLNRRHNSGPTLVWLGCNNMWNLLSVLIQMLTQWYSGYPLSVNLCSKGKNKPQKLAMNVIHYHYKIVLQLLF